MTFIEKLDALMAERHLNKNTLSKACGIPYTTIDGWYKKGVSDLKLSTLKKLTAYFGLSLDYWLDDDICENNNSPAPEGAGDDEEKVQMVVNGLSRLLVEAGWVAPGEDLSDAQLRTIASYVIGLSFYFKGNL